MTQHSRRHRPDRRLMPPLMRATLLLSLVVALLIVFTAAVALVLWGK